MISNATKFHNLCMAQHFSNSYSLYVGGDFEISPSSTAFIGVYFEIFQSPTGYVYEESLIFFTGPQPIHRGRAQIILTSYCSCFSSWNGEMDPPYFDLGLQLRDVEKFRACLGNSRSLLQTTVSK